MAKIDVSKIDGFDTMTAEQKLAALTDYDIPDPDYSGYVKKEVYDKTASDLADWKKKHNALLSEDERQKQANAEELESLKQQLAALQQEKVIAGNKAQLLALGYEEALAEDTAKAMAEGNAAKVFAAQKKFLESHDKAYKAKLMGETSTPPAGTVGKGSADYSKLIEDAQNRGDYAAVAYYTRLAEQDKQTE